MFTSATHKCTVYIRKLISFLIADMNSSSFCQKEFYQKNLQAVKKIYKGGNLWESESIEIKRFRTLLKYKWLIIPTNTQLVECWVKDSNKCTFNIKEESLVDAIAILCSTSIFCYCPKAIILSQ